MFQEIIGNDKNKAILEKAIQNHNLLHSYLFVGREGIGKKMMARQFAKKILCLKPDSDMDQKCESCTMFDGENHPDYHEIRPDGNTIKIEQIRQMNASVMEITLTKFKMIGNTLTSKKTIPQTKPKRVAHYLLVYVPKKVTVIFLFFVFCIIWVLLSPYFPLISCYFF